MKIFKWLPEQISTGKMLHVSLHPIRCFENTGIENNEHYTLKAISSLASYTGGLVLHPCLKNDQKLPGLNHQRLG
jgi:hypothetical protein